MKEGKVKGSCMKLWGAGEVKQLGILPHRTNGPLMMVGFSLTSQHWTRATCLHSKMRWKRGGEGKCQAKSSAEKGKR